LSFRGRLLIFFTIIVIVPMIAVALVLFALSEQSETGKADAGIAAGLRNGLSLYGDAGERADPALRRVASDRQLRTALARNRLPVARARIRRLLDQDDRIVAIELYDGEGELVARAGSESAVALRVAPLVSGSRGAGSLAVSVTEAGSFVRRLERISGLEASVLRGGRLLATTMPRDAPATFGPPGRSRDAEVNGKQYRGSSQRVTAGPGPPVDVAAFQDATDLNSAVSDNRKVIFGILLAFFLLALACSVFVSRALQAQIQKFLAAARRLALGDFQHPVPTQGRDEFSQLGREFNSMSEQLAAKIEEVERKRRELEETIRRVGDAFATGLNRQGVVELAAQTALDACEADAGRALPLDRRVLRTIKVGEADEELEAALETAEREAFRVRPDVGAEFLEQVDPDAPSPPHRRASAATAGGAHALAMPLRARLGAHSEIQYVGVISIARRGRKFSRAEEELLEYLTAQAVVSVENSDMHQTVQRQAVTDELTGLANVRQLHGVLQHELERAWRFESPLGLVMLDIDDFKQVNDTYGHQQGDVVLASVARALRDLSRDIDEPARYGGEEMAVVLPQTDAEGAALLAERMREAVEGLHVPRVDGDGYLAVTASFGVASIPFNASDKESLIAAADAALYRAKRSGKNRVEVADGVTALAEGRGLDR
jgi:diguanylate cyclase (GGDEF)-like protein